MQIALVTEYKTRKIAEGATSWATVGRPPVIEVLLDEDICRVVESMRRILGKAR